MPIFQTAFSGNVESGKVKQKQRNPNNYISPHETHYVTNFPPPFTYEESWCHFTSSCLHLSSHTLPCNALVITEIEQVSILGWRQRQPDLERGWVEGRTSWKRRRKEMFPLHSGVSTLIICESKGYASVSKNSMIWKKRRYTMHIFPWLGLLSHSLHTHP